MSTVPGLAVAGVTVWVTTRRASLVSAREPPAVAVTGRPATVVPVTVTVLASGPGNCVSTTESGATVVVLWPGARPDASTMGPSSVSRAVRLPKGTGPVLVIW